MWLGVSSRESNPFSSYPRPIQPDVIASRTRADGSTLSNPNTSEEAKKHAREELKKMGVDHEWFTDCRRECDGSEVLPVGCRDAGVVDL